MPGPDSAGSARRSGRRTKPDLNIDTSPPPPPPRARDREGERDRDRDRDSHRHRHTDRDTDRHPDRDLPQTPSSDSPTATHEALRLPQGHGRATADIETFLEGLTPVDIPIDIDMSNKDHDRLEPHPAIELGEHSQRPAEQ